MVASPSTYEDLEAIPEEREGDRHELFYGELVVTAAPLPGRSAPSDRVEWRHHGRLRSLKALPVAW